MAATEVNSYIGKRYQRWHDYSFFHCSQAGIADSSGDVLDEVLLSLLRKDDQMLLRMLNSKRRMLSSCDFYTELDYYVLRMIKINVYSETAPFRHKYKTVATDPNIKISRVNIEDIIDEDPDIPAEILERFQIVRDVFQKMDLPEKHRQIFEHRFFFDLPFSKWTGPESKKELYETYNKVVKAIKSKL